MAPRPPDSNSSPSAGGPGISEKPAEKPSPRLDEFFDLLGATKEELDISKQELQSIYCGVLDGADLSMADALDAFIEREGFIGRPVADSEESCGEGVGNVAPVRAHGLVETGASTGRYVDASKTLRGMLHWMNRKASLKATCKKHRSCICWLSNIKDPAVATNDLVEWLAAGADDRDPYQVLSTELKRKYGMRIRSSN